MTTRDRIRELRLYVEESNASPEDVEELVAAQARMDELAFLVEESSASPTEHEEFRQLREGFGV